jgi:hypothetical protein
MLTLGLKAVPCDALDARSAHECCDAECPDLVSAPGDPGHAQSPDAATACCAASEEQRHQQDNRLVSAIAAVAPPEINYTRELTLPPARVESPHQSSPPDASAAGLYVLFSVFRL